MKMSLIIYVLCTTLACVHNPPVDNPCLKIFKVSGNAILKTKEK